MNRFLTSTALSALFAGAAFVGVASAQSGNADYCSQGWSMIDTDQDGTVSQGEFDAGTSADFSSMDADGNGMVSQQEYQDCHNQAMQSAQSSDQGTSGSSGNGSSDRDWDFGSVDADASGGISSDEYRQSSWDNRSQNQGGTSTGASGEATDLEPSAGGDTGGSASMGSDDEAAAQASYRFRYLDSDGDGEISETEWTEGGGASASTQIYENRFGEIDSDGDGNLSQEEFQSMRTQQRDQAQQSAQSAGEDTSAGVPVYFYRFYAL